MLNHQPIRFFNRIKKPESMNMSPERIAIPVKILDISAVAPRPYIISSIIVIPPITIINQAATFVFVGKAGFCIFC